MHWRPANNKEESAPDFEGPILEDLLEPPRPIGLLQHQDLVDVFLLLEDCGMAMAEFFPVELGNHVECLAVSLICNSISAVSMERRQTYVLSAIEETPEENTPTRSGPG